MKALIFGILLSFTANANNCANLEAIANDYKKDLKAQLGKATFPKDPAAQAEFKAKYVAKFNYLKGLKHQTDVCYQDYGMEDIYNCSFSTDLIKERHDNDLITTYTSAINVNGNCLASLYLGHTMTRNTNGKVIYKKLGGKYDVNTLYKCSGSYTNEEYSFRKFIISDDNFFIMDQYLIYRTDVKVIAKKYKTDNKLKVTHTESEVIFNYGDALFAISTRDGSVTRSNFISLDEVTEGTCQTRFDASKNIIYPRTNVDEAKWGFELEYVSY